METTGIQTQSKFCPSSKKIKREISKPCKKSLKAKITRKHAYWSPEEDAQVIALVAQIGIKWTQIGKIIGDRTGKQVRERYLYTLNPDINKDEWTKEEDARLISLYDKIGNRWKQIATYLPGRTENQIKNRFKSSKRPALSSDGTSPSESTSPSDTASTSPSHSTSPSVEEMLSPIIDLRGLVEFNDADSVQSLAEMSPIINFDSLSSLKESIFGVFRESYFEGEESSSYYSNLNMLG